MSTTTTPFDYITSIFNAEYAVVVPHVRFTTLEGDTGEKAQIYRRGPTLYRNKTRPVALTAMEKKNAEETFHRLFCPHCDPLTEILPTKTFDVLPCDKCDARQYPNTLEAIAYFQRGQALSEALQQLVRSQTFPPLSECMQKCLIAFNDTSGCQHQEATICAYCKPVYKYNEESCILKCTTCQKADQTVFQPTRETMTFVRHFFLKTTSPSYYVRSYMQLLSNCTLLEAVETFVQDRKFKQARWFKNINPD